MLFLQTSFIIPNFHLLLVILLLFICGYFILKHGFEPECHIFAFRDFLIMYSRIFFFQLLLKKHLSIIKCISTPHISTCFLTPYSQNVVFFPCSIIFMLYSTLNNCSDLWAVLITQYISTQTRGRVVTTNGHRETTN